MLMTIYLPHKKYTRGFSLIELMVAVAIVAILASIALPSYQDYIIRASREAVQTELVQLANLQEKIYLNANAYTGSVTAAYNGSTTGGLGKTTGKSEDSKYNITVSPVQASQQFTLTATPVPGKTQEGDGNITINSVGSRTRGSKTW